MTVPLARRSPAATIIAAIDSRSYSRLMSDDPAGPPGQADRPASLRDWAIASAVLALIALALSGRLDVHPPDPPALGERGRPDRLHRPPPWALAERGAFLGLVIGWFAIAVAVLLPRRGTAAAAT